jgi:AraC family transcriptional regulator
MAARISGSARAVTGAIPFTSRARLDAVEQLAADPPGVTVTRYLRRRPGHGLTTPSEAADAVMAVVRLQPCPAHDQWRDGRHVRQPAQGEGTLAFYDLRPSWVTDLPAPFHTINFHLPRAVLDAFAAELGPAAGEFAAADAADPVMLHLALALLPALARPEEVEPLFVDHVLTAVGLHLARRYGTRGPGAPLPRGGLAPWQEKRAKEMMAGDLRGQIGIAGLAAACGLSPGHFLRAFRRSAGLTPHRWLQEQRLATARRLLAASPAGLAEIAAAAGFADQSHFTRVFARAVGTSPGAWRRRIG